jgi:hypothetical protein
MMWLLVNLGIYIGFCSLIGWFGSKRRFGFLGYLVASFFLTPFIGLLLVVASDQPRQPQSGPSYTKKIIWELDELRSYLLKFESSGLTSAETKEVVHRVTTLQNAIICTLV